MAYEETLRSISLDADSSLAAYTGAPGSPGAPASPAHGGKQYHFVKVTGPHTVGIADADDTTVVGVMQNKPQVTGQAATVGYQGVTKVVADKSLAAGALVKVSAAGQATDTGAGPTVGIVILGVANAGELASVLLKLG